VYKLRGDNIAVTPRTPAAPAAIRGVVVLVALVLAALNLRPALASVGPLLPAIQRDLGLSGAEAGLLTTIPSLCFGFFAPVAPRLASRFGVERTMVAALALLTAAVALRSTGGAGVLFAATLVAGVVIAISQTLLPAIVKRRFASRAILATGIYALSVNLGALLAASLSAPLSSALGGSWRGSLALWSLLVPVAVLTWLLLERRAPLPDPAVRDAPRRGLPWRSRGAWALTLYMGGLSIIYIVALTWLAPLYHHHGYSDARAGAVLSVFTAAQIASGLIIPLLAHRRGDRRWWLGTTVGAVGLGVLGAAVAPTAAPWLWACVAGLGMGGAYPLVLALFVDRAASPQQAGELTAMGFCGGYLIAAIGPAGAGAISDLTGSLAVPFGILAVVALIMVITTPRLVVARVEDAT
jgi:CP family cyanate transporter-like MFS transporter